MSTPARITPSRILGLDIGGANLKAATIDGCALSVPFPLWREPQNLVNRLRDIVRRFRPDRLAVTMTGELCDCFASKRDGVRAILDAVAAAAPKLPARVWSVHGRLVDPDEARTNPLDVASANWHALSTFAGRWAGQGGAILIDIGSTTTDVIPLWQGRPIARGLSDPARLTAQELVYTGVRRTPVCAVVPGGLARELFATMHDVYLVLRQVPEEPENCDTADGRPATRPAARARLARMRCDDAEHFSQADARRLALKAFHRQAREVAKAIRIVADRLPQPPRCAVLAGAGAFLARTALCGLPWPRNFRIVPLHKKLSPELSTAACAYALAVLAAETG